MKKAIGVFCIISILFLTAPTFADAESGGWYRAEKDDVVFYKLPSDTDSQKLFLLEKTYYVFATASSGGFLRVQLFDNANGFAKISGFVRQSDVSPCDETPVLPHYPTETLSVNMSNALLKAQPSLTSSDIAVALNGQSVCFYGKAWSNPDWYYVKYETDFGFVQSRQLSELSISPHPTPIFTPEPEPLPDEKDETDGIAPEGSAVEIILILLICIPAVVIVLLLFMPQKKHGQKKFQPPKPKYMSENDAFDDLDLL